jgi:hypothetical protein
MSRVLLAVSACCAVLAVALPASAQDTSSSAGKTALRIGWA